MSDSQCSRPRLPAFLLLLLAAAGPAWPQSSVADDHDCFPLSVRYRGLGTAPLILPEHSDGCADGAYRAGEVVVLRANPAIGWYVRNWSGAEYDLNTSIGDALLTMPSAAHSVSVTYRSSIPSGYYDSVTWNNQTDLRFTLHEVIDDHTRFPYTSTATDTWNILELADEDPQDPASILDVYKNAIYLKAGGGNSFYNREHTWPNSYGFPNDVSSNYPYTDCHALFLSNSSYNSSRGNNPYRTCDETCTERTTDLNHGRGGGSGTYPGNSNWRTGSGPTGTWETWNGRRGDVARALFYLDIRYEGGTHGVTGTPEPDLILTDDAGLIATSGGMNASVAYMGIFSTLLAWHSADPVDELERHRNDIIYSFQGNRNPFIDHPEWVSCAMADDCSFIFGDGFESGDAAAWFLLSP